MSDRLLAAAEVADLLGFSTSTILDWFEADKLPGFKIGRAVRFREGEVIDWIEAQRKGPGTRGEVSPTPSAVPTPVLVFQASPTPLGGEDAS